MTNCQTNKSTYQPINLSTYQPINLSTYQQINKSTYQQSTPKDQNIMDKSYFKKQSFQDASEHQAYYNKLSNTERDIVFLKLMQAAYGFVGLSFPKMDKIFMGSRKIGDE